jgi:hypothetical protein
VATLLVIANPFFIVIASEARQFRESQNSKCKMEKQSAVGGQRSAVSNQQSAEG